MDSFLNDPSAMSELFPPPITTTTTNTPPLQLQHSSSFEPIAFACCLANLHPGQGFHRWGQRSRCYGDKAGAGQWLSCDGCSRLGIKTPREATFGKLLHFWCHFPAPVLRSFKPPSCFCSCSSPISPQQQQQHHSHRVAMETAERHASRVRDGERTRDSEGHREREREQAARMAGMETFTDGSTGKFSHPQQQKKTRPRRSELLFLHVSFHLSTPRLYTPPFPFLSNHNLSVVCHFKKRRNIEATCRGARLSSWQRPGERQWREKYRS
ncbi:hypothetical protein Q5P01_011444 [Channa striata]|uniref:Uncharacterized protein n=1 Tax=Channa striata TaxID=64152 RepID=A0AA88MTE5_CHASR|nr:hypothetical protein Q5P01_011444 [Channa striata]